MYISPVRDFLEWALLCPFNIPAGDLEGVGIFMQRGPSMEPKCWSNFQNERKATGAILTRRDPITLSRLNTDVKVAYATAQVVTAMVGFP